MIRRITFANINDLAFEQILPSKPSPLGLHLCLNINKKRIIFGHYQLVIINQDRCEGAWDVGLHRIICIEIERESMFGTGLVSGLISAN